MISRLIILGPYMEDILRIKAVCLLNGYDADVGDCEAIWSDVSDDLCANWLFLPPDDETLWRSISDRVESRASNITTI